MAAAPRTGATSLGSNTVLLAVPQPSFQALLPPEWALSRWFHNSGSMQVRIFRRKYTSSRSPKARRWRTRILLLSPPTKPSETLGSEVL